MNDELKAKAEALGIKIDARWSEATLLRHIADAENPQPAEVPKPVPQAMLQVKLLKNYAPRSMNFTVIEEAPPPVPGVAFVSKDKNGKVIGRKLWADTVVALPRDEAKALLDNEAVSMDPRIGPDGKPMRNATGDIMRQQVRRRFPLAERADPLPV